MTLAVLLLACPRAPAERAVDDLPEQATAAVAVDPTAVLEASAATDDPGARARALALLVAAVGAEPWGERGLRDESDWVVRAVVDALGARSDARARALLEGLATDGGADPYVRGLAALRAPGTASATAMSAAWPAEAEAWRVAPLALAAVRLGDEAARPALEGALATGELPLDLEFLEELGRSGDAGVARALGVAQDRVEEELVLPVAAARLVLGDATAEQVFRKALGDADEERRLEALDFLVEIDHPAATALLHKASSAGPDLVREYAGLALAARSGTDSEVFERAFAQPDRELRALAVHFAGVAGTGGLGGRRTGRAVERVVLAGLDDADAAVRAEAARAVAGLRLAEGVAGLGPLLGDEVEPVRIEAAGGLLALR